MEENKKEQELKGISRRDFARKIAQGMVAFLVVASVGKGYAGTCIDKTDTACTGSGTEVDENCGSQGTADASGHYSYDEDEHCGGTIGTSKHRDEDDDCGVGSLFDGTNKVWAADKNCGSTYGPNDTYDPDSNCGNKSHELPGTTWYDEDQGCKPAKPGPYDEDQSCHKKTHAHPEGDPDDDGVT